MENNKMDHHRAIGFELKILSNMIKRRIAAIKATEGQEQLTGMHGWIIGYLYDRRDLKDVFQRDIEADFTIRRSTATGILQLMEKNGLLYREPVSYDARLKKLVLTPKAISNHEATMKAIHEMESNIESGLTKEEIDQFFIILDKIKKNVE
jgi:DNA-binding MarR family transcriptional regulator